MKRVSIFLIILFSGCFSEKHNLIRDKDYNRLALVENISLFGPISFDTTVGKKDNIQLLFKNDELKFISSGNTRLNKYAVVHKVDRLNDSTTILSWQNAGTHRLIDTLLIWPDVLHIKSIHHCGAPAQIRHTTYRFTRKHLVRTEEYLNVDNSSFNESIQDRLNRRPELKTDTLYKYSDIKEEKLKFLRRFIYHLD